MPKIRQSALTAAEVVHAKPWPPGSTLPDGKPRRFFDRKLTAGRGLFLHVTDTAKTWRLSYRDGRGKQQTLTLFPCELPTGEKEAMRAAGASITAAKAERDRLRALIATGGDPAAEKRTARAAAKAAKTFKEVAEEWRAEYVAEIDARAATRKKLDWAMGHILPDIGALPIGDVTAPIIYQLLKKAGADGKSETRGRVLQRVRLVLEHAVREGLIASNVAATIPGRARKGKTATEHRAAILEPRAIGLLMRRIGTIESLQTRYALQLLAYLAVRPSELRLARWDEFSDLDGKEPTWLIPATRTKQAREHLVALPRQAVEVLKKLRAMTASTGMLLPSPFKPGEPISDATLLKALRGTGYAADEITCHGFRSTFSTTANEAGKNADLIELMLNHAPKNAVRAAYNRAARLEERKALGQWYANELDRLRDNRAKPSNVTALRKKAGK